MKAKRYAALRDRVGPRRVVLSVSGGKDSAAASLFLREAGIDHDRVFADTGWEHPKTYEYLRGPLTEALGPIVEVRAAETFVDLVRKKRIFPDRTKRFCTVELKVKPIAAYLAALPLDEEIVNVVGIRRDESEKRKSALEWEYSKTLDCDVWRPLSGLCELHYWKREAERAHAELDAATTRGRELVTEAELAAHSAEVERDAANALVILLRDVVAASLYGSAQEKANAYLALARHDAATMRTASKPLSLTRETVLNLTPRAAKPPPTLAPPIDVAVEKEGKR